MPERTLKDLLLSPALKDREVSALLSPAGFQEIKKADANLQLIADDSRSRRLLSEILEELFNCLARSPDPDQALTFFERYSRAALNRANLLSYLKDSPYTLWLLIKLFGSSPFLSEVLIRFPNYLYWIADRQTLEGEKTRAALAAEAATILKQLKTPGRKLESLCIFKNKELLRIGVRERRHARNRRSFSSGGGHYPSGLPDFRRDPEKGVGPSSRFPLWKRKKSAFHHPRIGKTRGRGAEFQF